MGIIAVFGAIIAFVSLDLAALRWGVDSRQLGDGHAQSEVRELLLLGPNDSMTRGA